MALSTARKKRIRRKSKRLGLFLRDVLNEFLTDNCPHLAASISYYTLFSLFPLTLAAIAILGWMTRDPDIEVRVIDEISNFLPVASNTVASTIEGVRDSWEATGIIAVVGLLWGGSAIFNATRKAINAAWGIREPRPFFTERFLELSMMIGLWVMFLLSLGVTASLSVMRKYSLDSVDVAFIKEDFFWNTAVILATVLLAFLTFLLLFKYIPNTRVRWSDVCGGALLAAIGFEGTKQVFLWYATNHSYYHMIYGPVGTVVALMLWIYLSAFIMLFCAKLTSVYSRSHDLEPPEPSVIKEETSDTAVYPMPMEAPSERVTLRGRRIWGDILPSFSSVQWMGPVGVSRPEVKNRKKYRTSHDRLKSLRKRRRRRS